MVRLSPLQVLAAVALIGCAGPQTPVTASLDSVKALPAQELALNYLTTTEVLGYTYIVPLLGQSFVVVDGDQKVTIDRSNSATWARTLERRKAVYEAAIGGRGYRDVAGVYEAESTESCAPLDSGQVTVAQVGPLITVTMYESKVARGSIVENKIALYVAANRPSTHWIGEVSGKTITLQRMAGRCSVVWQKG